MKLRPWTRGVAALAVVVGAFVIQGTALASTATGTIPLGTVLGTAPPGIALLGTVPPGTIPLGAVPGATPLASVPPGSAVGRSQPAAAGTPATGTRPAGTRPAGTRPAGTWRTGTQATTPEPIQAGLCGEATAYFGFVPGSCQGNATDQNTGQRITVPILMANRGLPHRMRQGAANV